MRSHTLQILSAGDLALCEPPIPDLCMSNLMLTPQPSITVSETQVQASLCIPSSPTLAIVSSTYIPQTGPRASLGVLCHWGL